MPTVTLTFAGALALLNLWLAYRVVRLRLPNRVMIGDGDDLALRARMRAQANFVEYTPFVLVLMALIEICGGSKTTLWAIGWLYVVGRILHAFGMDRNAMPAPLRAGGALVTWLVLLGLALWAIWLGSTLRGQATAVHYL